MARNVHFAMFRILTSSATRRLMFAVTTAIAVAVSVPRSAVAEPCPVFTPSPEILQRDNSVLAGGEGVIVRSGYEIGGTSRSDVDASQQPTWRFTRGSTKGPKKLQSTAVKVGTTMELLAPGLTRYVPDGGMGTLSVTVAGKLHRVSITPALSKRPLEPFPAPTPVRITMQMRPVRGGGRPNAIADAVLQDPRPPSVVAVIVYGVDAKGVATPRSFMKVYSDALSMQVYTFSTRACQPPVPSTIESNIGDQVALAWVNELGRVSQRSATLTIVDAATLTPALTPTPLSPRK